MNEEIKSYIEKYPDEIKDMFENLRAIIKEAAPDTEEKMWAKLPSYYIGERFVRLIPFKNHINIEAAAMTDHKDELDDYKLTPKGMLSVTVKQSVPAERLKIIFKETLL